MQINMNTLIFSNNRPDYRFKNFGDIIYGTGMLMIFLTLFLIPFSGISQATLGGVAGKGIDMNIHDNGFITEIPMASPKTLGSALLFDQWLPSNLDFGSKGKAAGLYIRYDILNSIFDIRLKDKVKSIDGSLVERFSLVDTLGKTHFYVNCNQFKNEKSPFTGFFEILVEGKYQLFLKTEAVIIESTYVPALDLGEKNNKIDQKTAHYIAREKDALKVPSSKKALGQLFPEINGLVKYMKSAKINLRSEVDLKKLVTYMNSN